MRWVVSRNEMTLAGRVTLAAVLSAVTGGFVAVVVTILSVDWLMARHADRRLAAQTSILANELDEEAREQDGSIEETLDDENEELVTSGIRLAVYQRDRLLAGDPWVPRVGSERCITRGEVGRRVRACGRRYQSTVLVAAERRNDSALYGLYLVAGLTALALAGGLGAVASARSTRWALEPLSRLARTVAEVLPDQLDARAFATPIAVAEVEALRRPLHEVVERLREHLTRLERFAADAAHELRTPLTLLRGELELLAEDIQDEAANERLTQAAQRTSELSELVDTLLSLAQPERDLSSGFQPVAMDDVISDILSRLPREQSQRVHYSTSEEGLIRGDHALLMVLAKNAVDNALKFSGQAVDVTVSDANHTVTLTVRDFGPGVPEALRQRVFDPFFRVRDDVAPGYGLGLSLVGHIARVHGGSVSFRNVDKGSELSIELPAWTGAGPLTSR